jgi:G6PDH family F420-dependent oxidoreductase
MVSIGYALSSEEHDPRALIRYAQRAEDAGFTFALVSDHFHPWTDRQGQSPFVWGVLGALAEATQRLQIGTGVTCPILRIHPAIIAQAAATAATLLEGRFFLGLGSGENLNEHVLGDAWPTVRVRQEMLAESIEIIRKLWEGKITAHRGEYYLVDEARIYTLPEQSPPIFVAAKGERAGKLAGELADGLIAVAPDPKLAATFDAAGGQGKPRVGQVAVCWAVTEEDARRTVLEWWPNNALAGTLGADLKLPRDIEAAAKPLSPEQASEHIIVGPDPEAHLAAINKMVDAGYDHVYIHQIGPQQDEFFRFCEAEIMPRLSLRPARLIGGDNDATGQVLERKAS